MENTAYTDSEGVQDILNKKADGIRRYKLVELYFANCKVTLTPNRTSLQLVDGMYICL